MRSEATIGPAGPASRSRIRTAGRERPARSAATGTVIARGLVFGMLCLLTACAAKTPPALPAALPYADFMYPTVPPALQTSPAAAALDRGWRYLQNDDLGNADREFTAALRRAGDFYPARTGEGYVALARRNYERAVGLFDTALQQSSDYVPALVGRGQALLADSRDAEALASFERALAVDGSLADLRRRVDLLRFRNVQDLIERARTAASDGRLDEARDTYTRALAASPESAFLYRELGVLERRAGNMDTALAHLRRAVELDSGDAVAWMELGEVLEARQDLDGAVTAYRTAVDLGGVAEADVRLAAATERVREARLPSQFQAIGQSPAITRGELAALLGVRLETLLRQTPPRQEVVTDIRGHWASTWIDAVVRAGVMDAFENHTFQPQGAVRRRDLATAVSRVVRLVAASDPALRAQAAAQPRIADVTTGHLDYPAAATAVASGMMTLVDGQSFQLTRPVSGAEALDVVTRLRELAARR